MPFRRDPGKSKRKRHALQIKRSDRIFIHLLWITVALFIWGVVYPRPYLLIVFLFSIYPFVVVILIQVFKNTKGSTVDIMYLSGCVMFPCMIIYGVADNTAYIIHHGSLIWILSAVITAILWFFSFPNKRVENIDLSYSTFGIFVAAIFFAYMFSILKFANSYFDNDVKEYDVKVVTRRIERSRHGKDYVLKLDSWEFVNEPKTLYVGEALYDQAPIGATVTIQSGEGLLGSRWYRLVGDY